MNENLPTRSQSFANRQEALEPKVQYEIKEIEEEKLEQIPNDTNGEDDIIIKCRVEEIAKRFFKDYVIIWHDPNVDSDENKKYVDQLEKICKVETHTEWEQASVLIQETKAACHVITSGTNGELLVKEISASQNVLRIYIFCHDQDYHSTWAGSYSKISCVETQIEKVIDQIEQNLFNWQKEASSLTINLPAFAPIFDDGDKSSMNNLHRYLKVLPNFKNRSQAKNDFLGLSRAIYSDGANNSDITFFEKIYHAYNKKEILRWYTKESFLFKVTNNCLRIATSDSIQYCRLLLKDLEQAIKEQYQEKSKSFAGLLYRGAFLSDEEWRTLKANLNKEIEMHGFLSASKDKKVASKFLKSNPIQKVLITILVPKGLGESEQGFAEVEEYSEFPKEQEVLFNVRSRFTVLEADDRYSPSLPYRHLVLLYGVQDFRKYIVEKNPVQRIFISDAENISCSVCQDRSAKSALFRPLIFEEEQEYLCKKCLHNFLKDGDDPLLCIPPMVDRKGQVKYIDIQGILMTYPNELKIPMYGYKCCQCQVKRREVYYQCIECSRERKSAWCENCLDSATICMEAGHNIVLESNPFSFWCEKMPQKELDHLKFQNETSKCHLILQPGNMYIECQEYEKAIEFYNIYIEQNKKNRKTMDLFLAYIYLASVYYKQEEHVKAIQYNSKAMEVSKSLSEEHFPSIANFIGKAEMIIHSQVEGESAFEDVRAFEGSFKAMGTCKLFDSDQHLDAAFYKDNLVEVDRGPVYLEKNIFLAICYNNRATVYESQADYRSALEDYSKALEIFKLFYGENHHPAIAKFYSNIAMVYQNQAEYRNALEHFSKALNIYKTFYGDNDPDIATCYNNIALVYKDQAEYKTAFEYFSRALEIFKLLYGENHPMVATSFANIGALYSYLAEWQKSFESHFKALEIYKSLRGNHHPAIAKCYSNIAMVYQSQAEYRSALEYFSKALEIEKAFHGDDNHPDVAKCYNNIGTIFLNQTEYGNALEHFSKALEIYKAFHGDHPDIATCYNNIGTIFLNQAKYERALQDFSNALEIYKTFYGNHHPDVATCYNNIGMIFLNQEKYERALKGFFNALKICKAFHSDHHPDTARFYNNIGMVFHNLAKYESSLQYFSKALNIWKSFHGDNHPDVGLCYQNLGYVYASQTEYMIALDSFSKALKIWKSFYDHNHFTVKRCYRMMADTCQSQAEEFQNERRYNEALEYYTKALENYRSLPDDKDKIVAMCYKKKGAIYQTQGEYQSAYECYSEAEKIMKLLCDGNNHSKTIAVRNRMFAEIVVFENKNELRGCLICLNILYLILSFCKKLVKRYLYI